MFSSRARLGAISVALAAMFATAAPAAAQDPEPDPWAELTYTAAFDKPTYRTGDRVAVTLTITNSGNVATIATAGDTFPHKKGDIYLDRGTWGELHDPDGPGVALEPGQSHTIEVRGRIADPGATEAVLSAKLFATRPNGEGSVFPVREAVPVEPVSGAVSGTVYLDRDGDRQVDPGEAAAGASVTVGSAVGEHSVPVKTDATGRFSVTGLAPVRHYVSVADLNGWEFDGAETEVVADQTADVAVPGSRPFAEALKAEVRFTRDEYEPGDTAEIDVTLTNKGAVALHGIMAFCDRGGSSEHVREPWNWGDLTYGGDGVSLGAGETRRIRVTATVPPEARHYGVVSVSCDFGYDGSNNPTATDYATIPGSTGSVTVVTYQDRDSDGVADKAERVGGLDVTLTDIASGKTVVTRRAGADGVAAFDAIPTGRYDFAVSGPWSVVPGQHQVVVVAEGCWMDVCEFVVNLAPGKDEPPTTSPSTPAPSTTAPAPAPRPAPPGSLPDTGADVRWLFGLGVLTVLVGAGLMLVRRRKGEGHA